MDLEQILKQAKDQMSKSITFLDGELLKVRAGKANPQMLEGISVDYYGAPTPINQVANITTPDPRTISLQPWEKSMISAVEKAILMANIGLTPTNDGEVIRLFLPPLTEERRKELVKRVNTEGEQAKIVIRNIRRDAIEQIKKLQKEGLSEDAAKDSENEIQNLTNRYIANVDTVCKEKEKEIMTI